jgi:hypothetical protein
VLKASSPAACGGTGPKWTLKGKIKKGVFKGILDIRFPDGEVVRPKATLNAVRTP